MKHSPKHEPGLVMRYFIETWGCQMNMHDTEKMAGGLRKMGFQPATNESAADLIILNTCSVREKAAEKVFDRLGRLKPSRSDRSRVIGVAGCVAQQEGEAVFARAPHVDFVLGTQSVVLLPDIVERVLARGEKVVETGRHPENLDIPPEQIERVPGVKAFVTIMEGCDNFCSFCVVPFTRGRERCRSVEHIVEEVTVLAGTTVKEVQLLGQNVNSYRDPIDGRSFAELLDAVADVEGIERIRFTSPHPKDFDRGLMKRFRDLSALCPHMHLPAQSGSTAVLGRMRRDYTREEYLARVSEARECAPEIALSTDLIVGFCGETDAEFEETMSLVHEVGYDSVFSFKYSPRPYTLAIKQMEDDVPEPVKAQRLTRLQKSQQKIQERKNASWLGKTVRVLVDGRSKKDADVLMGRSPDNRVVNFAGRHEWRGRTIDVKITRTGPNSLFGNALELDCPSP